MDLGYSWDVRQSGACDKHHVTESFGHQVKEQIIMSLERGTYGIEYDGNRRNSGGKLWLLPVLIPLVIVILVLRGCYGGKSEGVYSTPTEEPPAPDLKVERERPSIMVHFVESWHRKFRGKKISDSEEIVVNEDSGRSAAVSDEKVVKSETTERSRGAKIPVEVERLMKRADELEQGGDFVSARMILEKLRLRPGAEVVRGLIEKRIGEINIALVLSGKPMPGKLLHKIKAGDLISRLARKHKNTQEYIMRVNSIDNPAKIRIGQELWVLDNPIFELMIDKSDFKAVLLFNHRFFKVYTIGVGDTTGVPTGSYIVSSRGTSVNNLREEIYRVALKAGGDTPAVRNFWMRAADNESLLGRQTAGDGILFSASEAEELYVLLPAGATVTIVP